MCVCVCVCVCVCSATAQPQSLVHALQVLSFGANGASVDHVVRHHIALSTDEASLYMFTQDTSKSCILAYTPSLVFLAPVLAVRISLCALQFSAAGKQLDGNVAQP